MHADNEMPTTEQHTEHEETSSSGWKTQRLPAGEWQGSTSMTSGRSALPALQGRNNNIVGLVLIGLGILLWGGRALPGSGEITAGLILLTIASCFLFFAFWKHIYGLLIPGSILAGLSLGIPLVSVTHGVSIVWGLALGFLSILMVGRTFFNVQSPWPSIPAVILFGVGAIIAFASLPSILGMGLFWLPLLLIGAGLFLGWNRRTA